MLGTVCGGALYIVAVDVVVVVVVVVEEEEKVVVVVVVEELEAQVPRPRTNIHIFIHIWYQSEGYCLAHGTHLNALNTEMCIVD